MIPTILAVRTIEEWAHVYVAPNLAKDLHRSHGGHHYGWA